MTLKCDEGEPGIITWQPDNNTPDTVYYQCFTHRHLGWKINVLDSCDSAQASEIDEVFVKPEADEDGLLLEASQRYETKIRPNEIFLLQHEKDLIKNHNMNEQPPKIQFDLSKNSEINKIIAEGIKAAEALEDSIAKPKGNHSDIDNENINTKIIPSSNPISNPQTVYSTVTPKVIQIPNDVVINSNLALSEYLRPPSVPNGPLFRPVQLPQRRPTATVIIERRRPTNNLYRPYIVPQPSMIINHYKKPISPLIRPFVSQSKPIKAIAPFLVLNQSNDQYPSRKTFEQKVNRVPQTGESKVSVKSFHHDTHLTQQLQTKAIPIQHQHQYAKNKPSRETPIKIPTKNVFKTPYIVKEEKLQRPSVHHDTGFKLDSVIVEGGFRPIVKRRLDDEIVDASDDGNDNNNNNDNRRRDDNVSDIDDNGEGDALFVNQDVENKQFEPMFIPSPMDSTNTSNGKLLVNEQLMDNMDVEVGDDKIMMAGERVDAYYLPPDNRKIPGRVYPGSVITYDGKAVSDYSLVNPLPPPLPSKNNFLFSSGHLSKTEQLIRNTPQFGPFHGEFPPLSPDFVPPEITPHLRSSIQNPLPVTEYTNPITTNTNPISTKLTLLKPAALVAEQSDELSVSTEDVTTSDKPS